MGAHESTHDNNFYLGYDKIFVIRYTQYMGAHESIHDNNSSLGYDKIFAIRCPS